MEVLGKKSHGHAVISGDMPSIGRIEADLLFVIYFFSQLGAQNKEPGD